MYSPETLLRTDFSLDLDAEAVLRSQGIDPNKISPSRRILLDAVLKALEAGLPLLAPRAVLRELAVAGFNHNHLDLAGGARLTGSLVSSQLAGASSIVVVACTVGDAISEEARRVLMDDPPLGLALDGLASAAVEALAARLCSEIEAGARTEGLQTSLPLNPGMEGWPVAVGQPQIFALLDAALAGVRLTPQALMVPVKSVSFVIGMGTGLTRAESACDFCTLSATCRYRQVASPVQHSPRSNP